MGIEPSDKKFKKVALLGYTLKMADFKVRFKNYRHFVKN